MQYSEKDLVLEIESLIESQECAFEQSWLATAIMKNHTQIQGPDKPFFELCGWGFVKATVRSVIRRLKPSPEDNIDSQLVLPGFKHLQRRYCVERYHRPWIVPVEEMTDHELAIKAKEYRGMADGCMEHADELERYITIRRQQNPA